MLYRVTLRDIADKRVMWGFPIVATDTVFAVAMIMKIIPEPLLTEVMLIETVVFANEEFAEAMVCEVEAWWGDYTDHSADSDKRWEAVKSIMRDTFDAIYRARL